MDRFFETLEIDNFLFLKLVFLIFAFFFLLLQHHKNTLYLLQILFYDLR